MTNACNLHAQHMGVNDARQLRSAWREKPNQPLGFAFGLDLLAVTPPGDLCPSGCLNQQAAALELELIIGGGCQTEPLWLFSADRVVRDHRHRMAVRRQNGYVNGNRQCPLRHARWQLRQSPGDCGSPAAAPNRSQHRPSRRSRPAQRAHGRLDQCAHSPLVRLVEAWVHVLRQSSALSFPKFGLGSSRRFVTHHSMGAPAPRRWRRHVPRTTACSGVLSRLTYATKETISFWAPNQSASGYVQGAWF